MEEKKFGYHPNISYIFIPLNFGNTDDFQKVCAELNACDAWTQENSQHKYMLRYVSDKFNSSNPDQCRCFHFSLNDSVRSRAGIAEADEWYSTRQYICRENPTETFPFRILGTELFCFASSVCIMAFKISFRSNNPLTISAAQFYLKKVSAEKIYVNSDNDSVAQKTTFLDMAKKLVSFPEISVNFNFFCFSNDNRERSNILTYIEVENKENYKEELFYLRRCYNDGFIYFDDDELNKKENYAPSPDTHWGITSEAAVCLACPGKGREKFIKSVFYKNFNTQYLFTYVLLLHQKYALYTFLSKLGNSTDNDLETLEKYQHELYEFETDFVFSYITEVPQYQHLYTRIYEAFHIDRIFEDVNEPIKALSEVRRNDTEKSQKKRDGRINTLLVVISVFSVLSTLSDCHDYISSLLSSIAQASVISFVQFALLGFTLASIIFFACKLAKKE